MFGYYLELSCVVYGFIRITKRTIVKITQIFYRNDLIFSVSNHIEFTKFCYFTAYKSAHVGKCHHRHWYPFLLQFIIYQPSFIFILLLQSVHYVFTSLVQW